MSLSIREICAPGIVLANEITILKPCLLAIANKIRDLRSRRRLRQNDVAQKTGISPRYYQEIEAGRVNMTLNTLLKLSRFFKTRLQQMVAGCPDVSKK